LNCGVRVQSVIMSVSVIVCACLSVCIECRWNCVRV